MRKISVFSSSSNASKNKWIRDTYRICFHQNRLEFHNILSQSFSFRITLHPREEFQTLLCLVFCEHLSTNLIANCFDLLSNALISEWVTNYCRFADQCSQSGMSQIFLTFLAIDCFRGEWKAKTVFTIAVSYSLWRTYQAFYSSKSFVSFDYFVVNIVFYSFLTQNRNQFNGINWILDLFHFQNNLIIY